MNLKSERKLVRYTIHLQEKAFRCTDTDDAVNVKAAVSK